MPLEAILKRLNDLRDAQVPAVSNDTPEKIEQKNESVVEPVEKKKESVSASPVESEPVMEVREDPAVKQPVKKKKSVEEIEKAKQSLLR